MSQKIVVVLPPSDNGFDTTNVSQVLDQTARSLQNLARTLDLSSNASNQRGANDESVKNETTVSGQSTNGDAYLPKRRGRKKKADVISLPLKVEFLNVLILLFILL